MQLNNGLKQPRDKRQADPANNVVITLNESRILRCGLPRARDNIYFFVFKFLTMIYADAFPYDRCIGACASDRAAATRDFTRIFVYRMRVPCHLCARLVWHATRLENACTLWKREKVLRNLISFRSHEKDWLAEQTSYSVDLCCGHIKKYISRVSAICFRIDFQLVRT